MMASMASRICPRPIGALEYMEWILMTAKARSTRLRYLSSIWIVISPKASTGKKAWTQICLLIMPSGAVSETQRAGKESLESGHHPRPLYSNLIGVISPKE